MTVFIGLPLKYWVIVIDSFLPATGTVLKKVRGECAQGCVRYDRRLSTCILFIHFHFVNPVLVADYKQISRKIVFGCYWHPSICNILFVRPYLIYDFRLEL